MNRAEAKRLAETVSNEDLKQMFINAKNGITNWEQVSSVNGGMTKGTAFNILSKCRVEGMGAVAKTNCLREFGEWLPNYSKPVKKEKVTVNPVHQEPTDLEDSFFNL